LARCAWNEAPFDRRPERMRYIAAELGLARKKGVPMEGLCWYPILNRPRH